MNGKATVAEFFSGALQTMAKEGLCAVDVNMKWGEKDVQFQLRVLTVDGQPIETLAEALDEEG